VETAAASPAIASLVDLLEVSATSYGTRPLFLTKGQGASANRWVETTYGQFMEMVDHLRGGLAALGVERNDRIGIIAGNRIEWAVAAYATYGLGAAFVPMYESQHDKDWAFIARDSGLKVLFVANAAIHARVTDFARSIPTLRHVVLLSPEGAPLTYPSLLKQGAEKPTPPVHPAASDTAALVYTSGTTGEPKGVVLSHGNIVSNVLTLRGIILSTEKPEEHRTLSFLPWAHAFGHTAELHMLIASGSSMGIAEGVEKIVDNIKEVKPTALVAVPRVFNRIYAGVQKLIAAKPPVIQWLFRQGLDAARRKAQGHRLGLRQALLLLVADRLVFAKIRARFGGRLKFAISGAASLAKEVAEFIDGIGITVYEGYGLTETSPIATANIPGHRKMGSVGRPIPGVRIVIDTSMTKDPGNGEVIIYGPNVMQGYHNRDRESRAVFTADGGLRTGDMGYLDQDNYLFITGRIKEQYKLANGKYVVPSPLEDLLKLSPFLSNVMIYGDNRPYNVALVVPAADAVLEWAGEVGLASRDFAELLEDPKVKEKIASEIERLSSDFKRYERIRAFKLIAEDFTQQNEMLTPSMKLRRRNVMARWTHEVEKLYLEGGDKDDSWSDAACDVS
jgi:long-chain acyl-CoA synthetase